MGVRGRTVTTVLGGWLFIVMSGCASLDDYRRVQAQNRSLAAEKEAMGQDLFDARTANDALRVRNDALGNELSTKNELVANYRSENEVLDDMRKMALSQLESIAGKQALGNITISGPKLPEQLDSALKRFADEHPSAVSYDSRRGTIKWQSDLLFPLGSDVVKQSSMEALRGFSDVIKSAAADAFEVIVVGHTDNRPIVKDSTRSKHPTNWHLSAHRAISVGGILQKFGYSAERVGVTGYGEFRPVADNGNEDGARQNRRVEIYLVPRGTLARTSPQQG